MYGWWVLNIPPEHAHSRVRLKCPSGMRRGVSEIHLSESGFLRYFAISVVAMIDGTFRCSIEER